jgi:hypothetical protein
MKITGKMNFRVVLLLALLLGCAGSRPGVADSERLKGPWFSNGPSFDFVIQEDTILFEFDMREHRYRLDGHVLVIEYDDGIQRKRILRLTADQMEWQDETFGTRSVFFRKGVWER